LDLHTHFSSTYAVARQRFCDAARRAGARGFSRRHPTETGLEGEALTIDAAWLGPAEAPVVVLSLSGTHGPEGYAGSAAQTAWLTLEGKASLPRGVAMLFVHAVNPWGFSFGLRVNEQQVDLNRNAMDFTRPLPPSPIVAQYLALRDDDHGDREAAIAAERAARDALKREHGAWAVHDALSRGQYEFPDAPGFGGRAEQWSLQALRSLLQELCSQARHIAYIDWHTLIEKRDGEFVFLCFNEPQGALFERAGGWWGREAIDPATVDAQWAADPALGSARPSRNGLLMWGVQHWLAPHCDVAGAVVEFCRDPVVDRSLSPEARAVDSRRVFAALRRGATPPPGARERLLEASCPSRTDWRQRAVEAALQLYRRTLEGARAWAAEDIAARPGRLVRSAGFGAGFAEAREPA
jgi:hypothetical protein